jgi:acetyltransferase EpsM
LNKRILGRPVLGSLADLGNIRHDAVVIGIGDNETRCRLFEELLARKEQFATVIHPRATLAHDVRMGIGTVVFAGVVVNTGANIGDNVILNTSCTIDHDCEVASHSHICPGAHLGGTVGVGVGAFVGIGSTIIHNKNVGEWSTVGAGAVVIKDVAPLTTVVGVPARPLPPGAFKRRADTRDLFTGK